MSMRAASHEPQRPLAAVLAGGAGSRIGGTKPATPLGGRALIAYPLAEAAAAGLEVVVLAKRDSPLPPLDCEIVLEPDLPRHPLCGILSALEHADGRAILALACDMPFLTAPLLAWLADQPGAAVVELDDRLQPLLARYVPANRPVLEQALADERSVTSAVQQIAPMRIDASELARFGNPARLCFNVNDAADLAAAERWLSS